MSLHYLLDGYNITKQIPALSRRRLKGERESLIRLVEIHKPQGSRRNRVTIIFDGQEGIAHNQNTSNLKVVFSQRESGDEKIRRLIAASSNKKCIVVVTDDKELRFSVKALGARVLDVRDFLVRINVQPAGAKIKKTQNVIREDQKQISKTLEYKITEEFKDIWLSKGKRE